ncbi:MAG TPA: PqqD family protein [Polyangiales bacterium]|nr:PqqD family protein [Polyangiales bacterium]
MLSLDALPRRSERTAFRVVGGEGLLMVIDRRELHRLNAVGARVFELCDGANSVAAIVSAIVREYAVDRDTARADVERFVTELDRAGALQLSAEAE